MTTEQHILRIDRKLTALLSTKQTWVTAQEISKLTGWDGNALRRARERKYLEYKQRPLNHFFTYLNHYLINL